MRKSLLSFLLLLSLYKTKSFAQSSACGGFTGTIYLQVQWISSITLTSPSGSYDPNSGMPCPDNTYLLSKYRISFFADPGGTVPISVTGLRLGFEQKGGSLSPRPEDCLLPTPQYVSDNNPSLNSYSGTFIEKDLVYEETINYWNGTCGFDSPSWYYQLLTSCPSVVIGTGTLPVLFNDVKAINESPAGIRINWSNLTETDVRHYIIERSDDRQTFHAAGIQPAEQNNGSRADYSYLDHSVPSPGEYLYRIRALELSGSELVSRVVSIKYDYFLSPVLRIYPNPVRGNAVRIGLAALPMGTYSVSLTSTNGQQQPIKQFYHPGGRLDQPVLLPTGLTGLCQLQVRSGDKTFSASLILINQ